jgi:Cu/Ag efflux protein CusF
VKLAQYSVLIAALLLASCGSRQQPSAQRHYALKGKIVALNAKDRTAAVDAAAIPNFMDAMTMDYPVKSTSDFASLHVGDSITATVDVNDDGGYSLSNIHVQGR